METLKIMCTGEIQVDFHDLIDLQMTESGKSLKKTDDGKINKLAKSLREYGIINNLQVWIHDDKIYCFDAHHRKIALYQLEREGMKIPLLPATRCLAKDFNEAKKLLLLKESKNSWIDVDAIDDFLADIDFGIDEAKVVIEIPDFEWTEDRFEKLTEKEIELVAYKKTHILISFSPEIISKIQKYIEEIIKIDGVEYEQSSN